MSSKNKKRYKKERNERFPLFFCVFQKTLAISENFIWNVTTFFTLHSSKIMAKAKVEIIPEEEKR
ncbi:hypothetical protein AXI59_03980 [Bacillus nakamurai]|uniref:Uncharacterized protein n=1 Tax=Bacillus nakamurai TaxID=1793963 RepID=A0A150FAA1_9BACI|nr:hypothetical protein AXI59_03980 [Bacillus nakamurai]KXZ22241.1 hypothetical protein AXI58_09600 [Bacillus nakamurai]